MIDLGGTDINITSMSKNIEGSSIPHESEESVLPLPERTLRTETFKPTLTIPAKRVLKHSSFLKGFYVKPFLSEGETIY